MTSPISKPTTVPSTVLVAINTTRAILSMSIAPPQLPVSGHESYSLDYGLKYHLQIKSAPVRQTWYVFGRCIYSNRGSPIQPVYPNLECHCSFYATNQGYAEVYVRHLLPKKCGFPLWVPKPHPNLPEEYRRKGVDIGDVGIVTSNGVFDFLFNICLPANDPINDNLVPPDFTPLDLPRRRHVIIERNESLRHLASSSIQMLSSHPQYLHSCTSPEIKYHAQAS
jgi:hypothetical protein